MGPLGRRKGEQNKRRFMVVVSADVAVAGVTKEDGEDRSKWKQTVIAKEISRKKMMMSSDVGAAGVTKEDGEDRNIWKQTVIAKDIIRKNDDEW